MIEKFLTTEQVANILQIHPFTVLKFIKNGKLKGVKLGRVYRIKEDDVKEFLEGSQTNNQGRKKVKEEKTEEVEIKEERTQKEAFGGVDIKNDEEHYYLM